MNDTERILVFCVHLGQEMLLSGATLERVYENIFRICKHYSLTEVSIHLIGSHLSISAVGADGESRVRNLTISATGIHLERLRGLNALSYNICRENPAPEQLMEELDKVVKKAPSYPWYLILLGQFGAMGGLCHIFGGNALDILVLFAITALLFWVVKVLGEINLNRMLTNLLCMFLSGYIAAAFSGVGICTNPAAVMITSSFLLIPGIPMVNAVRNLFCNYEMNGLLGLFKVVLETLSIVVGLWLGVACFMGVLL